MAEVRERLRAHQPNVLEGYDTWAAVALILREHQGRPEVFLIRRAEQTSDPWSGHMAFPGGRREKQDTSLLHTVHRETHEEVGFHLPEVGRQLGQLDDVQAVARGQKLGMVIRPFAFEVPPGLQVAHRAAEVAESLWAPIEPLLLGERDTARPYSARGVSVDLPAYDVDGRIVWGLTYQMLRSFFGLLR